MELKSLRAVFGKLSGQTIPFAPGLNIIHAPNESGKSTLCAALRVMLYGLATRERGAAADKNRYMPWNGSATEGRLDLSADGEDISITRSTVRANSPMGQFSAVYTGTGEAVPNLTASDCGEMLLGVPREVFERSAFIRQSGIAIDQDKELERRIAALITTGEEDILSYSEASAKLKKLLNARKHNKTGRIPALENAIAQNEDSLARRQELHRELSAAQEALQNLRLRSEDIAAALAQHDLADAQEQRVALESAEAAYRDSERQHMLFARMLEEEHTPPQEVLLESRSKLRSLDELEARREELASRRAQAKAALDGYTASPLPAYARIGRLLAFPALAAFIFFAYRREAVLTAASGAVLFILTALYVLGCIRHTNAVAAKRSALEKTVADTASAYDALNSTCRSAEDALRNALGLKSLADAAGQIEAALARYEKLDTLARTVQSAKLRYEILAEQAKDCSDTAPTDITRPAQSREQLRRAERECAEELRLTQRRADTLEGQLRSYGERGEIEATLDAQRTELKQLTLEYDALTIAGEALDRANIQLQNRFSPELGRRAAELFARLTRDKYDAVLLDRSLTASAQEHGSVTARDVASLSQGAADQLYLALRLAICDLVLPEEKRVPLILDDALINFDDERCAAALDLLVEIAQERQILLLSCHNREAEYLRGRDNVHILSLSGLD